MLLESFTYGSQSTPFRPGKHESCEILLFLFFFFFFTCSHKKYSLTLQLVFLQSNKGHGLIGEPLEIF